MDISLIPSEHDPRDLAWADFLATAARRHFKWGTWDCVTFAAAGVRARTGMDHLTPLGLQWADAREASRLLVSRGGLRAAVTAVLGLPLGPLLAQTGDVVLAVDPHDPDERELLALCNGPHLVAAGRDGLTVLPLSAGRCCWSVPHG